MGGEVGEVEGLVGKPAVVAFDASLQRLARRRREVGGEDVEAGRGQRLGDGEADAAIGSGDDGGAAGHHASSVLRMWSATRSACAAMLSDGLTAAEVGRKPPSTTKRFL